jgi:sulfur carrier protein
MKVNGKIRKLEAKQSLADFLQNSGYDTRIIAVERNGEIVPKAAYPDILLTDQDTLEIVNFMGGG